MKDIPKFELKPANIVCPACGNGNYMYHLVGKNVGHLNMKCINCNSYFNFDELYKRRIGDVFKRKSSNANCVRTMTDEELAYLLVHNPWMTEKSALNWLRQEAE